MEIKLLYVEDDDEIRGSLISFLKLFTKDLKIANNGEEGLEIYKKYNPDIVISDIKMPKMTGIDMVKEIRKINPEQGIIFTTAYSESNYLIEAIDLQVDSYILKPIDLDKLRVKIESLVEKMVLARENIRQQEIINEISKLQGNMLAVLDEGSDLIFSNDEFNKFFKISSCNEFTERYGNLEDLFLQKEGAFFLDENETWLETIMSLDDEDRKVYLFDSNVEEEKVFLLTVKLIKPSFHKVLSFTEVTSIENEMEDLEYKAHNDQLTDIYNRHYFNQHLINEIEKYKRDKNPFSLVIFDIDNFKSVNDEHGHQIGDQILQEITLLLKTKIRKYDILARWGGEEFVILLQGTTQQNAKKVAEYIRKVIENSKFVGNLEVTCSFGIAEVSSIDDHEDLVKKADVALYRAKNDGKNRVETYR
jgi:diguanylate cyclase (GGDEF)-like protein